METNFCAVCIKNFQKLLTSSEVELMETSNPMPQAINQALALLTSSEVELMETRLEFLDYKVQKSSSDFLGS